MSKKCTPNRDPRLVPPGWVAVVDHQDLFLRWASREEVHRDRLPHRSVNLLVFDQKNRLIIQRRHALKATHSDYWDLSCSGHIEAGDYTKDPDQDLDHLYFKVAARELKEELGVYAELRHMGIFSPTPDIHYEHFHLFIAHSDGPFIPQEGEVEEIQRLDINRWDSFVHTSTEKITPTLRLIGQWAIERGWWRFSP